MRTARPNSGNVGVHHLEPSVAGLVGVVAQLALVVPACGPERSVGLHDQAVIGPRGYRADARREQLLWFVYILLLACFRFRISP